MRENPLKLLIMAIGLLVSLQGQVMAQEVVGTCVPGLQFTTIQAAVDAAATGNTVLVCPGNYPEQVKITKPLTVMGVQSGNMDAAIIVSPVGGVVVNSTRVLRPRPVAAQILVEGTPGVHLSKLTVDGANNRIATCPGPPILVGIFYLNASGSVTNIATRNDVPDNFSTCFAQGFGILHGNNTGLAEKISIHHNSVHSYLSVGIATEGPGTTASIAGNRVVGSAVDGNGIQVVGTSANISDNSIIDNSQGAGILCGGCHGATIAKNSVGNNGDGIDLLNDDVSGDSNNSLVTSNQVYGTPPGTSITVCADNTTVTSNDIKDASPTGGGIFLDSSCATMSSGNNNTVQSNTVNEACAGILVDPATTGNITAPNQFSNVTNTVKSGTTCP
jgi:hypothetical protein